MRIDSPLVHTIECLSESLYILSAFPDDRTGRTAFQENSQLNRRTFSLTTPLWRKNIRALIDNPLANLFEWARSVRRHRNRQRILTFQPVNLTLKGGESWAPSCWYCSSIIFRLPPLRWERNSDSINWFPAPLFIIIWEAGEEVRCWGVCPLKTS